MADEVKNPQEQMPELLEGISELRKCSFKPEEHFIKVRFQGTGDESFYLEVKWRMFWFQTYCREMGIQDYSIEEQPANLIQGTNLIQVTCIVRMDGKVAGQGVGGYSVAGGDIAYAVQQAATIAKGRALANAGFGTVFSSAAANESGGFEVPADSGLRTSEFFVKRNPSNPMQVTTLTPENDSQTQVQPTLSTAEPEQTESKEMTREEACRFKVPIRGKHFGETLGDVMGKDPSAVNYYATNTRYSGSELQKAAQLMLQK